MFNAMQYIISYITALKQKEQFGDVKAEKTPLDLSMTRVEMFLIDTFGSVS